MNTGKTLLAVIKCSFALVLFAMSLPASAVLYCYNQATGTASTWYVGNTYYGAGQSPEYCYATGVELDYIRQHFVGIRMRKGPETSGQDVVTWFGDDAQYLANNL